MKAGRQRRSPPPMVLAVLAGVVMAGAGVVLVRLAAMPLDNYDTYFHLRFGHEFLSGAWSIRDPGSVSSFATADWVPTQWVPQLVMAQVEDWFGLAGVAWLSGLQFLTLAVVLYVACRREAQPLVAAVLVALALVACSSGMSMRPQLISYILVVVTTATWMRTERTGRVPWLLVPVTWVWTMCHGMWPVGIVIGVVAVVGLTLDRAHPRPSLVRMAAVPALSLAVSLLSPVGPGLLPAVLKVGSRREYYYEWGPPDFTLPYVATVLLLLALALVPRVRRGVVAWFPLVLIGLAAGCAVYSTRTVPVAACLAAPLAAAALRPALGHRPRVARTERLLLGGGYLTALVVLALVVPSTSDEPLDEPTWMDPALGALPAGTVVLGRSGQGGYLMWRYPQLDLVAHGYGDTYTDDELARNSNIGDLGAGWVDQVRELHVDYAVLDPYSSLGSALQESEGWVVVHDGGGLAMLQPPPGWQDE